MQLGVCRGWYHCIYVLSVSYGFTLLLGVVLGGHCVWWVITLSGVLRLPMQGGRRFLLSGF